jgi:hypothetical protein
MTMTDSSGIYGFYFDQKPNEFYIGKGISIKVRVQNHLSAMTRGTHFNKKVQSYFNKYGPPVFIVLELCSLEDLSRKEIQYISEFDSFNNGLNLTNGGEGGGFGEGVHNSLYSNRDYYEVLCLIAYTNLSLAEIHKLTGVDRGICKSISCQSGHNWLAEAYPIEYNKVALKKNTRDNSASSKGIEYPILLDPNGLEYSVQNVHKFAEEHGLQYQNLHKVLTGKRKSHKGWKVKDASNC